MTQETQPAIAWEPVSPRGVAAFARASFERLFVVQSIFALMAAAAVTWLLAAKLFPTVDAAIDNLPATSVIERGKLSWPDDTPKLLAEGHFLAFSVDLQHSGNLRSPAHFQFEFGERSLCIYSLLGVTEVPYPPDQSFYFDRANLEPLWGAWAPEILGLAAIGTFFGLLIIWAILATLYSFPVWLFAFYADRDLSFFQGWKLAGATLMPGALIMSLAIVMYGLAVFDLVQFAFAAVMHLVIGWLYLIISPLLIQRAIPAGNNNPFADKD